MSNDLNTYNQLNHQKSSLDENDGFVEFLFNHSLISAPEVDENKAWSRVVGTISKKKDEFQWLKIAASIAILFTISIALYLNNSSVEIIQVSSNDTKLKVTFPDGSVGVLNEKSSFEYPKVFGSERRVTFEGEAYFDIQKSQKPFIIDVNGVEVKVLGTAFNLISSEQRVSLFVDRGLVAFTKNGVETKVQAGSEAIFDRENNTVTIKEFPELNIMSWRNGHFQFDNTPLEKVIEDLSEYYDVEFKLSNDKLKYCRISATIEEKSLGEVVKMIESILNVKATVKKNLVKISGQGC